MLKTTHLSISQYGTNDPSTTKSGALRFQQQNQRYLKVEEKQVANKSV